MARGKNPEETRQKILTVSKKLFLEKGYDNTSIQDIVNGLGGMTKGAIYQHFRSKFEIFETIIEPAETAEESLKKHPGDTGLEKLQNAILDAFTDYSRMKLNYSAAVTLRSPRFIGEQFLSMFNEVIPEIKKIVEEGIKDGSIDTDYPEEVADVLMMHLNTWIGLHLTVYTEEQLKRKLLFTKKIFDGIGVPIFNEQLVTEANKMFEYIKKDSN
ncbi:TetR/AcrR family transcriptional regulator [Candidatus Enterococcus murrayae]|uniref:TetR/AcrR family transcriptional regulator n=1 Tax=Candidatus Enterococcus murrayae TaxID=2815321 RepID=A0ABS3HG91_9ENTE|nr:TetR/AcrR family transcriptional regulator [Enterococcus sp. MJM16]MBO0452465.1 TetR/AcrR family transcriptional regulator [Enterococcus sp. MJM16]